MCLGKLRIDDDRTSGQFLCKVQLANDGGNPRQKIERLRMIRLLGQNLPIDMLRLRRPPGFVVRQRDLHGLIDGHLINPRTVCMKLIASPSPG